MESKLTNILLSALVVLSATMFIWTVNYISTTTNTQAPMAISAFNA